MTELFQTKPSSETHTLRRRGADTETLDYCHMPRIWPGVQVPKTWSWFFTGTAEHGTIPAKLDESSILPSQDDAYTTLEESVANPAISEQAILRYASNRVVWVETSGESIARFKQADRRYNRFRDMLIAMLLDEPIEDGVTHPVEKKIDKAFCADASECQDWLFRILVDLYPTRPSLSAAIIRCIGRLDSDQTGGWGFRVIDDALKHKDVEVRDAAIGALESWGGNKALEMLRGHTDSIAWMNKYIRQVIVDLGGDA